MAQTFVGLALGSHTIKVVELGGGKEGAQLVNAVVGPTPPGAIAGGQVNDPEAVAQTVKQLVTNSNIKTKKTVSALTGQSVIVRIIPVPRMAPNELKEVMRHEIERHIPFPIDEVVWDYRIIQRPDEDTSSPNMEVLFAAAQEDTVRAHVDLLQQAGLEPHAIEVEPLAVSRPLLELKPEGEGIGETVAVLDIGAATTEIAVFKDRLLHFPRSVPIGGEALTKAIAETLGLSEAQAERLKRERAEVLLSYYEAPVQEAEARPAGAGLFVPSGETLDQADEPFAFEAPAAGGEEEPEEIPFSLDDTAVGDEELPSFDLEEDLIIPGAAPEAEAEDEGFEFAPLPEGEQEAEPLSFDFALEEEAEAEEQVEVIAGGEEAEAPVFELEAEAEAAELPPEPVPAEEALEEALAIFEGEDGERQKREVYDAMMPVLGELVTEIRRSLEYYRSRHEGAEVNRLIVVGGTARMPGLAEFLAEELGIPAERGDPVQSLTVANATLTNEFLFDLSPVLTVAIGLGVRDLFD